MPTASTDFWNQRASRWLMPALLACAMTLLSAPASPAAGAADIHQGVASCAGGTCHGATRPLGDHGIRQDEYFIWQQRDPHARVGATLTGELARRMGAKLGIEPTQARQCLACHADAATPAQRGERWLASDGIGCETCHGASQRWLGEHTKPGLTPDARIAMGMTPTWQPKARAALCQSCHQGDAEHPITHAMMVAGHPPLLFELDTFGALQPPHYDLDADYQRRKGEVDPARNWAIGQAMAADQLLQQLENGRLGHALFPELALFDCDACHHPMNAGRWQPARNASAMPGTPPLADAPLYWLGLWLQAGAPEISADWQKLMAELQTATGSKPGALPVAAKALRRLLNQRAMARVDQPLSDAQLKALLRGVSDIGGSARGSDFLVAEQAAMAAQVFSDTLARRGQPADADRRRAIDALYRSVRKREAFQPDDYRAALLQLRKSQH